MDGDDLIAHQFENSIDDRLEALEDLFIRERHEALFNAGVGELRLDTDVDRPLLAVVAEVGLDAVFKVHDALRIHLPSYPGTVWQLHLTDLRPEDIAEIPVQGGRTARVSRAGSALGDTERLFLFDLVRDQIHGSTTAVDNQDGIADLQVQQPCLGAKQSGGFWLGDQGEAVIVLVAQEPGLDGGRARRRLPSIIPNGRHGQVVPDIALFPGEHLAQGLLQLGPHRLSQLEEVIGGDVNFGLARREGGKVDRIDIGVAGQHELKLEPLDFLDARLRVARWGERIGDIGAPSDDFLVLIVVQDSGNLGASVRVRPVSRRGPPTFCFV